MLLPGVAQTAVPGARALTVTPSADLDDGQTVTVDGTGRRPGVLVFAVECLAGEVGTGELHSGPQGFHAGEAVLVEQCAADSTAQTCAGGPSERWVADDEGRFTGTFVVERRVATDFQPVDCLAVECVLRADRSAFATLQAGSAERRSGSSADGATSCRRRGLNSVGPDLRRPQEAR